jgi:RimJ/RimL family protein N-acetyltransferase
MTSSTACRLLEWDSTFFGQRIARVEGSLLDAEKMKRLSVFVRAEEIDCVYFLADDADLASIAVAEDAGFKCVDVRVTRERPLGDSLREGAREMPDGVDLFHKGDLKLLQAIARSSHGATRFYHDPGFSRERCDALYERWITNSCTAESEQVFVIRDGGRAVAYVTCEKDVSTTDGSTGQIGLIAVAEAQRGRGLGKRLVQASLAWFSSQAHDRVRVVRVVSQARNAASARLYDQMGFVTTTVERWYHLWPGPGRSE